MNLVVPGLDPVTDRLLVEALDEDQLASALAESLPDSWARAQALAAAAATGERSRAVIERRRTPDLGDPHEAGWTYLVAADDPDRDRIAAALRPLARHRGMVDADRPLLFSGEPPKDWAGWITAHYGSNDGEQPHYVLIVGGPDRVPFHFQSVLDSAAAVGRLTFDAPEDLDRYVEKVLRLEANDVAATRREAVIFATNRGSPDPTYYSRRFMASPIANRVAKELHVPAMTLFDDAATAGTLLDALTTRKPALVYTATHGARRPTHATFEEQLAVNGALVCAGSPVGGVRPMLTAADLPGPDVPVAEGAVVFSFACFSAGTPAESDFHHWFRNVPPINAHADFVAKLPKALLAHPRGPVAFVGHVDLAFLHAFVDPEAPDLIEAYSPRLEMFTSAVDTVLGYPPEHPRGGPQPVGLAMRQINRRFDSGNYTLSIAVAQAGDDSLSDLPEDRRKLMREWIARSDAQNYVVLGDPAVYPRMSDD